MAELEGRNIRVSRVASGDLSFADPQCFRFLLQTNRDVHLCSASGQIPFGVLNNKPRDNEHATVCIHGSTKIVLAMSLGANARITTNNTGQGIAVSSGGADCGFLMTGAVSGAVAELFFTSPTSGD